MFQMRTLVFVLSFGVIACGREWKKVDAYAAGLHCGMSVTAARDAAVALGADRFEAGRSRKGFAQYFTGTEKTVVTLSFSDHGLEDFNAVRFFGLTGAEKLAGRKLCTHQPQSFIEYKVEASTDYVGADVVINGTLVGQLSETSVPSPRAIGRFLNATGPAVVEVKKDSLTPLTRRTNLRWDAEWAFVDFMPCP